MSPAFAPDRADQTLNERMRHRCVGDRLDLLDLADAHATPMAQFSRSPVRREHAEDRERTSPWPTEPPHATERGPHRRPVSHGLKRRSPGPSRCGEPVEWRTSLSPYLGDSGVTVLPGAGSCAKYAATARLSSAERLLRIAGIAGLELPRSPVRMRSISRNR